jgi:site-specific DNA-methyltransferase (adenine-specific)
MVTTDERVTLHHGDCVAVLCADALGYDYRLGYAPPLIPNNSVDAVVTDPPYGLEFMGKDWDAPWKQTGAVVHDPATERGGFQDGNGGNPYSRSRIEYGAGRKAAHGFQQWCEQWTRECYRVLKPGGHLLAFGGTRMFHRLACAVEDAGFEIRDNIAWLYGSGFPKSLDVSKAIDAHLGAERPDRVTADPGSNRVLSPTVTVIDAGTAVTPEAEAAQGWGTGLKPCIEPIVVGRKPLVGTVARNWLDWGVGALNIDGCRIGDEERFVPPGAKTSESAPETATTITPVTGYSGAVVRGRWPGNAVFDVDQARELDRQSGHTVSRIQPIMPSKGAVATNFGMKHSGTTHDDEGGASRYYLVAEPDPIDDLTARFFYTAKAPSAERVNLAGTSHPTVKPLSLMRWLVRLVTPPGGLVLEPFAGSGTTVEACLMEGMRCVAVERDGTYLPLIQQRIDRRLNPVAAVQAAKATDEPDLFDLLDGGEL